MFSSTVMDHFQNPRKSGILTSYTGLGLAGSREAGRFVQISLRLVGTTVQEARFQTYGCVPAIAASSMLAEWVEGQTVDEARSITPQQLIDRLGGLPPQRTFAAVLAIQALHNALDQSLEGAA